MTKNKLTEMISGKSLILMCTAMLLTATNVNGSNPLSNRTLQTAGIIITMAVPGFLQLFANE